MTRDNPIPVPPFWGSRCVDHIQSRALVPYINKNTLYKFQWGYKAQGRDQAVYRQWAKAELDPILRRLVEQDTQEQVLRPQAVYGYFPCQSQGDDLVIYDGRGDRVERCRFRFPRQQKGRHLCISDFFRSTESNELDVVAFQVVTVGQHASDFARELFAKDRYQDYLYWHGFNVETTEALAEYIHKQIRAELGFSAEDGRSVGDLIKQRYRGSRYSFGYPACPNLADQDKLLDLLEAQRIGVTLGDEYQLWPEESTSAIVVHHPQAKYFSA